MTSSTRVIRGWTAVLLMTVDVAILVTPAAARSQQKPAESKPAFEAATIKLAPSDAIRNRVMPTSPNRLSIPSMTLVWLVYTAYGDGGLNTAMRVTGGPDWANKTVYAIEGVAAGSATPQQRRRMLQTLLEERFALKVRAEIRTADVNVLVLDRPDGMLGPKVKEWNGTCQTGTPSAEDDPAVPRCLSGYRAGKLSLDGATMYSVAEALSLPQGRQLLGTITVDQTGLKGRYTMELDYPFVRPRPADPAAPLEFGAPSLSTAIREQWGLRVMRGQGPFKVVVIESAEPPTPN